MKRKLIFSLLIGALFIGLLFIRVPASMVLFFLPESMKMTGVEGTLWHGRASALGIGGLTVQDDITWSFQPKRLLKASLCWEITGSWLSQKSRLMTCRRFSGFIFDEIQLVLPIEPLARLDHRVSGLQLGGNMVLYGQNLKLNHSFSINGKIDQFFSGLSAETVLGNYPFQITFSPQQTGNWKLETQRGILKLDGEGTFDIQARKLSGQIHIVPREPIPGLSSLFSKLPRGSQGYTLALSP